MSPDPQYEDDGASHSAGRPDGYAKLLTSSTSVIAVGGLLVYGILSLAYGAFYGALGVTPGDVGLNYAGTLTGAVGLTLMLFALSFVVATAVPFVRRSPKGFSWFLLAVVIITIALNTLPTALRWVFLGVLLLGSIGFPFVVLPKGTRTLPAKRMTQDVQRTISRDLPIVGLIVVAVLAVGGLSDALRASHAVKTGHPISTDTIGPITILSFAASPVYVKSLSEPNKTPTVIGNLENRTSIFYLGQANGTVVLYDYVRDHAIYVPASSVVVDIVNCDVRKPSHQLCEHRFSYDFQIDL